MIKRLVKWLYFHDEQCEIAKIKGINRFLVDYPGGQRKSISPVWDWIRIKYLVKRIFTTESEVGK